MLVMSFRDAFEIAQDIGREPVARRWCWRGTLAYRIQNMPFRRWAFVVAPKTSENTRTAITTMD
jgi:hypothetical protein